MAPFSQSGPGSWVARLASLGALGLVLFGLPSCGVVAAFVEVFSVRDICDKAELDGTQQVTIARYADLVEPSQSTPWFASMIFKPGAGIDTLPELGEDSRAAICVYDSQLHQLRDGWSATSDDSDAKDIIRITLVHSVDLAAAATQEVRERVETMFASSQDMRDQIINLVSGNPGNASVVEVDQATRSFYDSVEQLTSQWRFVDDQLDASARGVHSTDTEDEWAADFSPEDLESAYQNVDAMLETFQEL